MTIPAPKIEPFEDRVLIQKTETEEISSGGIYIPDQAKEPSQKAVVCAVGPGRLQEDGTFIKMHVQVGDVVWVGKYSGVEVSINSDVYHIMRQADILGKVIP
jgi:chaperonin GroES